MFLQEAATPDNVAYLVLGLAVLALFLGVFVGSLILRARNLRRDMALLEQMAQEDASVSATPADRPDVSGSARQTQLT